MTSVMDDKLAEARKLSDEGRQEDAIAVFKELFASPTMHASAHLGIGVAMIRQGKHTEAADYLMESGADAVEVYINASSAYQMVGDEEGQWKALLKLCRYRGGAANHEGAYRVLADKAVKRKNHAAAYEALMSLFEVNSEDFTICYQLGQVCKEVGKHKQAVTFLLKAHELGNDGQKTICHAMLAGLYKDCGEQQQAIEHFRTTYERDTNRNAASNLIMAMQYTHGIDLPQFYEQCREYSTRFLRELPRCQFPLKRYEEPDRPLRIGFISGDFCAHSLSNLMLHPFEQFKRVSNHKIYIYFNREESRHDQFTERYKACVDKFEDVLDMGDRECAEVIRKDNIDILIDLAGHTAYNRLPVFGYKPAPVQMGWISGMMTPPAIETINYFITDPYLKPDCAEEVCDEKLLEIPASYTYYPISTAPDIGELPVDKNGYITFGSFNNPCKISDAVLYAWAKAVLAVPRSKLHIKVYTKATEINVTRKMGLYGVSSDRLKFVYPLRRGEDVMEYYNEKIDVVLDTWPCAGMLTSLEAMWCGCPVVTMMGETFLHRQTWTVLGNLDKGELGLKDLAANTPEEFAEVTAKLCGNRQQLRRFRAEIRDWMEASPIRDPELIARSIMGACEKAWKDWCESRTELAGLPRLIA